jgi:hypothetical protein
MCYFPPATSGNVIKLRFPISRRWRNHAHINAKHRSKSRHRNKLDWNFFNESRDIDKSDHVDWASEWVINRETIPDCSNIAQAHIMKGFVLMWFTTGINCKTVGCLLPPSTVVCLLSRWLCVCCQCTREYMCGWYLSSCLRNPFHSRPMLCYMHLQLHLNRSLILLCLGSAADWLN